MASPSEISASRLAGLIGTPRCPALVDICIDADFTADPRFIPGAFRHPFEGIAELADRLAGREVVVICQKGLKLSMGSAAILRSMGMAARYLAGGNFAWRGAGLPLIPAANVPNRNADGETLWVTSHERSVDGLACSWLIRRFIDPAARILRVAPSNVLAVADRYEATPFSVAGARWEPHGAETTFDVMIGECALKIDSLVRLADMVRDAAGANPNHAAQSAGFHAAAQGIFQLYHNDVELLDAGVSLCDAFYCWSQNTARREIGQSGSSVTT